MSIATKRAKERENRTPDELVMVEMVFGVGLKLGGGRVRVPGVVSELGG